MNLIERLLRIREEEKQGQAKKREDERRRWLREEEEEKLRREQMRLDRNQAKNFFNQSIFPSLAVQMIAIEENRWINVGGYTREEWERHFGQSDGVKFRDYFEQSCVSLELRWGNYAEVKPGVKPGVFQMIEIICDSSGKISIKGSQITELTLNKWLNSPKIQDQTMENAYKNPQRHRSSVISDPNPSWG